MRRSLRFVLLGFLLACGDDNGPSSDSVCKAPLQVFANNSVTPTVSWAGGCRVNEVLIRTDGPLVTAIWLVFTPSISNLLTPPLEFGVVPEGALGTPDNPAPLQPGETYIIDVTIRDSAQGGTRVRVGTTNLTVSPPD
jgi:hypothetical protein